MRKLLLVAVVLASACAAKVVPPPVVTSPRYPEFTRPAVPAAFANTVAATNAERGWAFLQAGDLRQADHEFSAAIHLSPDFYPAETSLGYLELARKDAAAALAHFDRAAELNPDHGDVSTSVGRGHALIALDRDAEAVAAFESALALNPGDSELARRVEVLKFKGVEQGLAAARDAARAGRLDEAVHAYSTAIASSPDSPFLYRELAAVEQQKGDVAAALTHLRKAVALDPSDQRSQVRIGDLLEARGDFEGAAKAYEDALAMGADPAVEAKLEGIRERTALARLPAEYRAIKDAEQITRADLAALIGVRLGALLQSTGRSDAALITDARNNWAATWIMAVARAGIMDPLPNHTFQPRAIVKRSDLAQTVARLLARVGAQNAGRAQEWDKARLKFVDLLPSHLAYPAASMAVAAGAMTAPGDVFQPARAATGAEATDAIAKIEALAGLR